MRRIVILAGLLMTGPAIASEAVVDPAGSAEPKSQPAAMTPHERVRDFVEASNRQDVDRMVAAVNDDFRWLQVEGAQVVTEVVGAEQLRSWLDGYFRSTPGVRSELGAMLWDGGFLTTVETVSWNDAQGTRQSQRATSLYRFDASGRIEAVWYFPAQALVGQATP